MTEDQMSRLIEAIENTGGESWLTWALPLITLLIGFGLSQLTERTNRRRAQKERLHESERAVIVEATRLALNMGSASPADLVATRDADRMAMTATFVSLVRIEPDIARWVGKQLQRLQEPPANGFMWDAQEASDRIDIATGVATRLDLWHRGALNGDDFAAENDDTWDSENRDNTAIQKLAKKRRR